MIRISDIPYNEQTRAVVRKFFDVTIARKKVPTIEDMRELRAGLVAVIGEGPGQQTGEALKYNSPRRVGGETVCHDSRERPALARVAQQAEQPLCKR